MHKNVVGDLKIFSRHPQEQVLSTKENFPRGTKDGKRDKDKRWRTRKKGKEQGKRNKGLPQYREETHMSHRKMAVYKGKKGNPVLR